MYYKFRNFSLKVDLKLCFMNFMKNKYKTYDLLQVGASHHRVVQLMGEAALRGQVTMILRRRSRQVMRYPYDVIVSRNENEGFGFVVISSSNQYYGSTIGK